MIRKKLAILFLLLAVSISANGDEVVDNNFIDWRELSRVNSSFSLINGDERCNVWAVTQARILSDGTGIGGFCGTAWLCKATNKYITFATAAHVVSKDTFYPKENNPVSVFVFLTNADGNSFPITIDNIMIYKEIELALITLPKPENYNIQPLPISSEFRLHSKTKVYNLGFPDRAQKDVYFSINLNPLSATFDKGPWIQNGNVISKHLTTARSGDVNLVNAECFRLSYASESGFSGGPLFCSTITK